MMKFLAGAGVLTIGAVGGLCAGIILTVFSVEHSDVTHEDDKTISTTFRFSDGDTLTYTKVKNKVNPTVKVEANES